MDGQTKGSTKVMAARHVPIKQRTYNSPNSPYNTGVPVEVPGDRRVTRVVEQTEGGVDARTDVLGGGRAYIGRVQGQLGHLMGVTGQQLQVGQDQASCNVKEVIKLL